MSWDEDVEKTDIDDDGDTWEYWARIGDRFGIKGI